MKINLPKHYITSRAKSDLNRMGNMEYVGLKEIPLAYINTDETVYTPYVKIADGFSTTDKKLIRPYDAFEDTDTYFFDNNNKQIRPIMKRIDDKYYYEPFNQTEYTPLTYQVYLKLQKQEEYWNDKHYDIKVSTIETNDGDYLADKLISIFSDKATSDFCPANIKFNGGTKNSMSLMEGNWADSDFVFIWSEDGEHLGDYKGEGNLIPYDTILDSYTNLWLFTNEYGNYFTTQTTYKTMSTLHMEHHAIFDTTEYDFPRTSITVFDTEADWLESQGNTPERFFINEAILIEHYPNRGFVIISPDWLLDDLSKTGHMIYEAMMYCYLQQYYKSRRATMWITDEPVDYLAYHTSKYGKNHNILTVKELMADYDFDYTKSKLVDVIVTTPYVYFLGVNEQQELLFSKNGGIADPVKIVDMQSFYTTKHTVINYTQEQIYLVETPLVVNVSIISGIGYVTVEPMISSSKKIYTVTQQTFKIEDFTTEYNLYVNQASSDMENTFFLIERSMVPNATHTLVGTISFTVSTNSTACDTRIMGGGIPLEQADDYDMLDIGHVYGRPYRVGSSLVIRLPKTLEQFEERIRTELDKHIAAGDAYVIVFED